jgi:hypothetical protein
MFTHFLYTFNDPGFSVWWKCKHHLYFKGAGTAANSYFWILYNVYKMDGMGF